MGEDQRRDPITYTEDEFNNLVQFSEHSRTLKIKGINLGEVVEVFAGDIFPYPASSVDGENGDKDEKGGDNDGTRTSFRNIFVKFLDPASYGLKIQCQYLRFVFRTLGYSKSILR